MILAFLCGVLGASSVLAAERGAKIPLVQEVSVYEEIQTNAHGCAALLERISGQVGLLAYASQGIIHHSTPNGQALIAASRHAYPALSSDQILRSERNMQDRALLMKHVIPEEPKLIGVSQLLYAPAVGDPDNFPLPRYDYSLHSLASDTEGMKGAILANIPQQEAFLTKHVGPSWAREIVSEQTTEHLRAIEAGPLFPTEYQEAALPIGDVQPGQRVVVLGYPVGTGIPKFSTGVVLPTKKAQARIQWLMENGENGPPFDPEAEFMAHGTVSVGFSGGPVYSNGKYVGVLVMLSRRGKFFRVVRAPFILKDFEAALSALAEGERKLLLPYVPDGLFTQ